MTPEYSVGGRRVDYSLRINNVNKVFIEVKKIGEELDNHQAQLLNYSFQEGVKLAILTNGITWWFYLPLQEGSWDQRKFYTIDMLQQEPDDIASKFMSFLSKENIANDKAFENAKIVYKGQQKQKILKRMLPKAWNKIITDPDESLVELLKETTEKMCGHKADNEFIKQFLSKNKNQFLIPEYLLDYSPKTKRGRYVPPSGIQKIRTRNVFSRFADRIEIVLNNLHTPRKYALIPLRNK